MKKLLFALPLLATLAACDAKGGDKPEEKKNPYVGKWEIKEAEGDMAEMNKGQIYTFTETEMATTYTSGKYTISGDTLIVKFKGMEDSPFKYLHKVDGNKMQMELLNSGGQKFKLEKQ